MNGTRLARAAFALTVFGASAMANLPAQADPVTDAIIANELPKCVNGVGVPGGCVGPGGEIRRLIERNIVGPVTDIVSGQIGQSDKSVWRQLGLPHIRLW